MKHKVTIHKRGPDGVEVWAYPGVIHKLEESSVQIEAEFDKDSVDLGLFSLTRGDRFLETYYFERWYNVFTINARETGRLKGWYCNIARPALLDGGDLYADDLALDLLRLPDGRMQLLDVDEFSALHLSEVERQECRLALDRLRWQMYAQEGPFQPTDGLIT